MSIPRHNAESAARLTTAERELLASVFEERRAGIRADDNGIFTAIEHLMVKRVGRFAGRLIEVAHGNEAADDSQPDGVFRNYVTEQDIEAVLQTYVTTPEVT